jgi:hypothetical protein
LANVNKAWLGKKGSTENRALRPDKKLHTPVGVPPSGLRTSLRLLV